MRKAVDIFGVPLPKMAERSKIVGIHREIKRIEESGHGKEKDKQVASGSIL